MIYPMVEKDILLRVIYSTITIGIGLIILKLNSNRNRDNLWGRSYRKLMGKKGPKKGEIASDKFSVVLGIICIIAGIIALFFGYRMTY